MHIEKIHEEKIMEACMDRQKGDHKIAALKILK